MLSLDNLRREYISKPLNKTDVDPDPMVQFEQWMAAAIDAKMPEPTAMTLATVDAHGRPAARIVLLKNIRKEGFVFYTNYESGKAREMEGNNDVALLFTWLDLHRQIRIEGKVEKINEESCTLYFQSRPRASQLGAWASPQSRVIESRQVLEEMEAEAMKKFEGYEVLPRPPHWGGYLVRPRAFEFWQGRRSRLHDRIRYRKEKENWIIERLAP